MDLEEAEEEIYFVNVLHEVGPNSDDEVKREPEETKEAVDACICRRAKRAGVKVVEPQGACMSEAE
jgi:hypothetical protein